MRSVYRDGWVYLFLSIAVATLGFMIFDAINSRKILGLVNWMYQEMVAVKKQVQVSERKDAKSEVDREHIRDHQEQTDARLDRIEASTKRVEQFTDEIRELDRRRREAAKKQQR